MKKFKRIFVIVIDSVGIGEMPDAEKFGDGLPALFHRRNRTPWLVTMRLEDWLKLYKGET